MKLVKSCYRILTIYNVFFRAIMADNTNTPGEAAPKKGNIKSFNVILSCVLENKLF